MSWFKKIQSVVDPIGSLAYHYGGKRSSSIKNLYGGLDDTLHFWDTQRVMRGVKKQWGVKFDPLGNQLNKLIFPQSSVSSAKSYYDANQYGIYGPNGSLIGRY